VVEGAPWKIMRTWGSMGNYACDYCTPRLPDNLSVVNFPTASSIGGGDCVPLSAPDYDMFTFWSRRFSDCTEQQSENSISYTKTITR
jgi:hypothetical protein